MISFANPKAQYLSRRDAINAAIRQVLDSGQYILGRQVEDFETAFAAYTQVEQGVGVGNGTDALYLALRSFDVGPGHEVITVSHTAVATVSAIGQTGATPVLVDIDPETYTMDPTSIASAITQCSKAIIPVHLYGQPANMDDIMSVARDHDLIVIEDCAQAAGAMYKGRRVGSIGDAGCFSFFPTKNLGALGDGGLVTTSDGGIAERIRGLRQYGWQDGRMSKEQGFNSRLDELQAAVLNVKLAFLDEDNAQRRMIAERYDEAFADLDILTPERTKDTEHAFHLYVIRTSKRDALKEWLRNNGVLASIHYDPPVHAQPAYNNCPGANSLAVTETVAGEILSLPIYPELAQEEQQQVINSIRAFLTPDRQRD